MLPVTINKTWKKGKSGDQVKKGSFVGRQDGRRAWKETVTSHVLSSCGKKKEEEVTGERVGDLKNGFLRALVKGCDTT